MSDADGALSILHVVPYFPPDKVGGVGEVVAHLHEALLRRGHQSRVLSSGTSGSDDRISRIAASPDGFVLASFRYHGLARAADVVHVHHGEAMGLLLSMRLRRVATPVLLTLHASAEAMRESLRPFELEDRRFPGGNGLLRRTAGMKVRHALDRAAMRLAAHVTYISRSSARDFLPPDRARDATVIYNGLPPASTSGGGDIDPVELLFVGTYSPRKRVQALPSVLAHVRRSVPGARLRVIGFRPSSHPEFLELARTLGVADAMVFEGVLESRDLGPFYRAAEVLLVPSVYEGLPMVVLEAFQHGLPCVATRVSGLPEVVEEGRSGLLVPPDQPARMADAAVRILTDPPLGQAMGRVGAARVASQFTVERQAAEYLTLYRRLRSGAPGQAGGPDS